MLEEQWVEKEEAPPETKKKKEELDPILTRTGGCGNGCGFIVMKFVTIGGAYIPPARLRMLQEQISDKTRYEILINYLYISPSLYLVLSLSLSLSLV